MKHPMRGIFNLGFIWIICVHTLIWLELIDFEQWEWWAWLAQAIMFLVVIWEDK